ncbi:carbohydrate ABC transporter permease [Paenibacillus crassostreae]|uniref:ABC transmembrane type-1 domain-containing protein n=1 Tax=Paenibacillus crassostreae TaxID=1763538 RepID=A0A167BEZ8_9BACL|nr:sugar ABC transporter permease [Paenibacillus crassostreae]AOZ92900.1 hypothetical protein LPB68_12195 [Paenibacillus crassostreae]OAB72011.1 hypothetical protein PNBC_18700 [Paenibacillus crassostreae]
MKSTRNLEPYIYVFPTIALLVLFTYYPFFKTVYDSFFYINASGHISSFAGIRNYTNIFTDSNFRMAVINTLLYVVYIVPSVMIISLFLALAANQRRMLSKLYETMYAIPMAMSVATTALVYKFLLNPSLGIFNYLFGLDTKWFTDKRVAMFTVSSLEIWLSLGINFLFMLSAIRNVPKELLESSQMEGAGRWMRVRYIILPLISPTLFFLLCTNIVSSVLLSSTIIILTDGGPRGATQSIIYYMYHQGFVAFNYSNAYASAIVGFILAFGILLASFIYERRGVHYQ